MSASSVRSATEPASTPRCWAASRRTWRTGRQRCTTPPAYDSDERQLLAPLTPVGGPVDVSGGWFDAGDFLKFTHTASYSTASLLLAQRTAAGGR
ncbi:hypothetical protein GCM10020000_82870 [Streptomyces olivoverticillatus]